jgi:hypothetical protein
VPLEHTLVALGLARLVPRSFGNAAVATLGLSLAGFAVHAAAAHVALAAARPGRPPFEPDVLREASVTHGLLFFDDDQGYELASEPGLAASHGVEAVRLRGDDHDRLLYDVLGHPAVHRYVVRDLVDAGDAPSSVTPWTPLGPPSDTWRFEAESDWPPIAQSGGVVEDVAVPSSCVSAGRVLRLVPNGGREATAILSIPAPPALTPATRRAWTVAARVYVERGGGSGELLVRAGPEQPPLAEWRWEAPPDVAPAMAGGPALREPPGSCVDLGPQAVDLGADRPRVWLELRARGGAVMLDRTTLRPR